MPAKLLHARFSIQMEMGQTIKSEHVPWLAARRMEIEPFLLDKIPSTSDAERLVTTCGGYT